MENEVEKRTFITNYFSQLFRSSGNQNSQRLLECVENKVTSDMNNKLLEEFTREEVVAALKSIGNLKAPGPDGLPALFYKEYWDIVGEEVVTEVLKVLGGSQMPDKWNNTTIVLIPKSQSAIVPGRLITDNILNAYEATHFLKQGKKGKIGYAAIKLDMSKAYNRVEWNFLRDIMQRLGFDRRWIELIMKCV